MPYLYNGLSTYVYYRVSMVQIININHLHQHQETTNNFYSYLKFIKYLFLFLSIVHFIFHLYSFLIILVLILVLLYFIVFILVIFFHSCLLLILILFSCSLSLILLRIMRLIYASIRFVCLFLILSIMLLTFLHQLHHISSDCKTTTHISQSLYHQF